MVVKGANPELNCNKSCSRCDFVTINGIKIGQMGEVEYQQKKINGKSVEEWGVYFFCFLE